MSMPTQSAQVLEPEDRRLTIFAVDFVGGDRRVSLGPGLNLVHGNITTGKTTFVRLIRALLGTVPSGLPEETEVVSDIRARLNVGGQLWEISRPLSSTRTAPVDLVEVLDEGGREPRTLRLPAVGSQASFGRFLLDQMHIPAVSVPQARSKPTESLTPVTMSDWLGYCVVTGDEIDAQVFGHHHPFRDQKRRWVFELAYGLYDAEVARLVAALKRIDTRIGALDREEELQKQFLAETPFSSSEALVRRIAELDSALAENAAQSIEDVSEAVATFNVGKLREDLLLNRAKARQVADAVRKNDGQLKDLTDLLGQLKSQFSRLTRAIISDEWLVDFDFVVCPRCGSDVEPARATDDCCYLCLQTPSRSSSRESFLAEQDRIVTQIQETESVIASRRESLSSLRALYAELSTQEEILSTQLNSRTQTFVSDRESQIAESASRRAYLAAERNKAEEYLRILERFQLTFSSRQELEEQKAEIEDQIARRELTESASGHYIELLEDRLLGYLSQLNVPYFGAGLSVTINRKTYLPEISGRTFDELSSQGLKTLVNVAHSLAHHTVAIDNNLPMPGLLVLDGLSANAGRRGFDEDRIRDVYQLLMDVSEEYGDRLQIIAVDNDPPADLWDKLSVTEVLHLTQEDKLIRFPSVILPSQAAEAD
ncbi:hypothetical protein GTZ78_24365 [Streptomyces sp. SID8361]|uniref:hypothetical protein n=1 Tax=Streptomyces sp. MnatMP-M27 TaxID=1839768 RepID=UPI00081F35CB|nr:hypothetical protein [Streptomyces sp. MnatMP-M27]MYU13736.1 hypothetical protein [Streptomyces sp. SID8361]SCG02357.1 hypothetical protein GA0115260_106401 [Streptomyces sp. MnatMP-M27]